MRKLVSHEQLVRKPLLANFGYPSPKYNAILPSNTLASPLALRPQPPRAPARVGHGHPARPARNRLLHEQVPRNLAPARPPSAAPKPKPQRAAHALFDRPHVPRHMYLTERGEPRARAHQRRNERHELVRPVWAAVIPPCACDDCSRTHAARATLIVASRACPDVRRSSSANVSCATVSEHPH